MKKLFYGIAFIVGLVMLLPLLQYFKQIVRFFTWLVMLDYTSPNVSFCAGLTIRILTAAITYSAVGLFFKFLNWFNTRTMRLVYFIISTILTFMLTWLFYILETYWWIFLIVFGTIIITGIVIFVITKIEKKKANTNGQV